MEWNEREKDAILIKRAWNTSLKQNMANCFLKREFDSQFQAYRSKKVYYTGDNNKADVVHYRDNVFLPKMTEYKRLMCL
jgi:hypothetical protein